MVAVSSSMQTVTWRTVMSECRRVSSEDLLAPWHLKSATPPDESPGAPLDMDPSDSRPGHSAESSNVIEIPAAQGLHHYYLSKAAYVFGADNRSFSN